METSTICCISARRLGIADVFSPPNCHLHRVNVSFRLHFHQVHVVRSHAYEKQNFPNSFLCSDAVESLLRDHKFPDKETAIAGLRLLQLNQLISLLNKKDIGESGSLARFGRDEKNFRMDPDISLAVRAKDIEEK